MNLPRRIYAIASASALALTLAAVPASAAWYTPDPPAQPGASIKVSSTAVVSDDGLSVEWPITFTCPKGDYYEVRAEVAEVTADDPLGIRSLQFRSGSCTGKAQKFVGPLEVIPTDGVLVPISPSTNTFAGVRMYTPTTGTSIFCAGTTLWCQFDPGLRITLK